MDSKAYQQLLELVQAYKMPRRAVTIVAASRILIVCGVTAAGKDTILRDLIKKGGYTSVVSHTTRSPRKEHGVLEQDGQDYWFVDEPAMFKLVSSKAFVEVKQNHGLEFYGTSIKEVERAVASGNRPITVIDVKGAQEMMAAVPRIRPLFVLPPSYDAWIQRLDGRGTINPEELQRRFASARDELRLVINEPQFAVIINHEFHKTVAEIRRGVDESPNAQAERRDAAQTLLDRLESV